MIASSRLVRGAIRCLLPALLLLAAAPPAWATHFRYGHISWKARPDIGTNTAELLIFDSFRRSGYTGTAPDGRPKVGDIISEFIGATFLDFGDGTRLGMPLDFLVVAYDPTQDWIYVKALASRANIGLPIVHSYATPGPYTAQINSCCRISSSVNAPDAPYTVSTLIDFATETNSPVSTLQPIVNCTTGAVCNFGVPAADADGDTLRWRLATSSESGLPTQPQLLSVDVLTGAASWPTAGRSLGLYSAQIVIEARDPVSGLLKTRVVVDFLIQLTSAPISGTAPTFSQTAPLCGTTFDWVAGKLLQFTIRALDVDPGSAVTLNAIGLPPGAVMNPGLPANGNPIASTLSWTPSAAQGGPHVIVFTAIDNTVRQAQCSMIVDVKVDSDGDGLPDLWETSGYTYNGVFVDLPALGAKPNHKDIFIEIDYMETAGHSHRPMAAAIALIQAAFANVPNALFAIPNPDGLNGITLHVDVDEALPHVGALGVSAGGYSWAEFDTIKLARFAEALSLSHHYSIWAHNYGGTTSSGIARGIPANDFLVSLGSFSGQTGSLWDQAGTFMHELGHDLGLRHGGSDHRNYKPNYLSVMNYAFQLGGLRRNAVSGVFDYSRFTPPNLNESNLNEAVGLNGGAAVNAYGTTWFCGASQRWTDAVNGAIDWNCNGIIAATSSDVNRDAALQVLDSYNDWANMSFKGGLIGAGVVLPLPVITPDDELTREEADELLPAPPAGLVARVAAGSIRLNWIPSGTASQWRYRVYRSTAGSTYSLLGEGTSPLFTDTSVAAGVNYSYVVTAIDVRDVESVASRPLAVVGR